MTRNEQNEKGLLEQYLDAEQKDKEGKPFWVRHKSSLLIIGLTAAGCIFCAVWSHYFPYGIW